jgi:hypothetical protein
VQTAVEVFRVISVSLDLNQTLNAVLDGLKSLIHYDAAGIYVIELDSSQLCAQVVRGYTENGGHEFGLQLPAEDKRALIAFLKTL